MCGLRIDILLFTLDRPLNSTETRDAVSADDRFQHTADVWSLPSLHDMMEWPTATYTASDITDLPAPSSYNERWMRDVIQ